MVYRGQVGKVLPIPGILKGFTHYGSRLTITDEEKHKLK